MEQKIQLKVQQNPIIIQKAPILGEKKFQKKFSLLVSQVGDFDFHLF